MRPVRKAINFRFSEKELNELDLVVRDLDAEFAGTWPPRKANRTEAIRVLLKRRIADIRRVAENIRLAEVEQQRKDLAQEVTIDLTKRSGLGRKAELQKRTKARKKLKKAGASK